MTERTRLTLLRPAKRDIRVVYTYQRARIKCSEKIREIKIRKITITTSWDNLYNLANNWHHNKISVHCFVLFIWSGKLFVLTSLVARIMVVNCDLSPHSARNVKVNDCIKIGEIKPKQWVACFLTRIIPDSGSSTTVFLDISSNWNNKFKKLFLRNHFQLFKKGKVGGQLMIS